MALRRASFTGPWLKHMVSCEQKNCSRRSPWTIQRRGLATAFDTHGVWTHQLSQLLSAIQTRDSGSIARSFINWTDALLAESPSFDSAVAAELQSLPHTTISEIVRNLDPIANPELDLAHGLRITIGQAQYVDVTDFADEFGVRPQNRRVLRGMQNLLRAKGCPADEHGLLTPDIETMMRCAGTVADRQAAISFLGKAPRLKGSSGRNSRTIREFLRATFALDPAYHQFDNTKVMLRGRDIVRGTNFDRDVIKDMDRLRFSLNALLREPWEREESHLGVRKQRYGRNRTLDRWAFRMQYAHWRAQGVNIDEEFLCTVMLGFSRSFAVNEIIEKVFKARYGMAIEGDRDTKNVEAGTMFPPGHPLRPTQRLLHATVDALGPMGQIPLCLSILDQLSRTYELPVTHELWSKILNWAYINSSKPIMTFRKQLGSKQEHLKSSSSHVREIIAMMTSEPFNISLSFEDSLIFAKTLIVDSDIEEALDVIREQLVPHHEARAIEHQQAIVDEVLRNEAAPFSSLASSYRRQQAEVLLDHTWHRIQHVIDRLIKQVSNYKPLAEDPRFFNFVPGLVEEFGAFLSRNVRYRTEQGIVTLWRSENDTGVSRIADVLETDRQMLPAVHTKVLTSKTRQQEFRELLEKEMLNDEQRSLLDEEIARDEARAVEVEEHRAADEVVQDGEAVAQPEETAPAPGFYTMTERRSVRQFTRIPAKRETDFKMPPSDGSEQDMEVWRAKVLRELTL